MKWHSLQSHSKKWSSPSTNCAHAERHNTSAALTRTEGLLSFTFSTHPLGPQWIPEESGIHKKGRIVQWFLNENNWDPNVCWVPWWDQRPMCNTWCLPWGEVESSRHGDCTKEQVSEPVIWGESGAGARAQLFKMFATFPSSPTYTVIFTDPTLFRPPRVLRHTRSTCMGTYTPSLK